MSRTLAQEKVDLDPKHLEIVQDAAVQQQSAHYTPQDDAEKRLDKRVNLKLDLVVLALLAIEFIVSPTPLHGSLVIIADFALQFCGIDKTNVGFVATTSFVQDAGLEPDDIPNSLSLFSATYVPLQLVMVILARRVGVKYFLGIQLITWGGLCMCHAAIKGRGTLIALRLLIGAAEAGFTQIGMYYMSTLYPKYDLALRYGLFAGM
jgi:MFS family permease